MKINNNSDYSKVVQSNMFNSNETQKTNKITADKVKVANENARQAKTPIQRYNEGRSSCPYSEYADGAGTIIYNGVVFQCDSEKNRLCLGDVTNLKNCLTIHLKSGSLVVNKNNLSQLSDAIGMFSPEDANIIMRALAEYQKVKDKLNEIEDDKMGIGQEDTDTENKNTTSDSENAYHVLKGNYDNINKDFDVSSIAEKQKEEQQKNSETIQQKAIESFQKKQDELVDENLTKEKLKEEKIADITEEMIERLLA